MSHIANLQNQQNREFEKWREGVYLSNGNYSFSGPSVAELKAAHHDIAVSFTALHLVDLASGSAAEKAASQFRYAESSFQRALQNYADGRDALSVKYAALQTRLDTFKAPSVSQPISLTQSFGLEEMRRKADASREAFVAKEAFLKKWRSYAGEPLTFPIQSQLEKCLHDSPLMGEYDKEKGLPAALASEFANEEVVDPLHMALILNPILENKGVNRTPTFISISEALEHCSLQLQELNAPP